MGLGGLGHMGVKFARALGAHELIRMDQTNEAYERMLRSDVKYRFRIDMASLRG